MVKRLTWILVVSILLIFVSAVIVSLTSDWLLIPYFIMCGLLGWKLARAKREEDLK